MIRSWVTAAARRTARPAVAGGVGVALIAAAILSRYSLRGKLDRDSAIYLYGGQRLLHGVPPYASIMDPKGPVSGFLCGFGVAVARLFGRSDVLVVRLEFAALSVAAAVGVYLLVYELSRSVIAGVVAGAVFATFKAWDHFAVIGPEGHQPGIVFLIFGLWLTVRRNWYLAGFASSLAFLSWQPLFPYWVLTVACAALWSPGRRWRTAGRAAAGAATPLLALVVYYAVTGHLVLLFQGLFVFPLTAVRRKPTTLGERWTFIVNDFPGSYGASSVFLWAGLGLLVLLVVRTVVSARPAWRAALLGPIPLLLGASFVIEFGYLLYDYIGYPHAYPMLPYAAVGIGMTVALALDRLPAPRLKRARTAVEAALVAMLVVMTVGCLVKYGPTKRGEATLATEQATACALAQAVVPGTPIWSLGDPIPLVLLHRVNPDNYPYEGSGLDVWKVEHTPGGFAGWTDQIVNSGTSVVVLDVWKGPYRDVMQEWLDSHGYRPGYIGAWRVLLTPEARARLADHSILLTHHRTPLPMSLSGRRLTRTHCANAGRGVGPGTGSSAAAQVVPSAVGHRLNGVQLGVQPAARHQLVVRADLGHA